MSKKKKIAIIVSTVIIVLCIAVGIVYAFLSDNETLINKFTIGSVKIENLNLKLKDNNNVTVNTMSPGDINTLTWTTTNTGTSGVLTRHTLEIYWEDIEIGNSKQVLYLFPANIKRDTIISDYKEGEDAQYLLSTESISETVSGVVRKGIRYQFIGDTLDGTSMKNVSNEVNYNSLVESVIDSNISTDDEEDTIDEIAYRVLMNPELSYLYQGKRIYVKVKTEAMQYTENGSANWKVVNVQEY